MRGINFAFLGLAGMMLVGSATFIPEILVVRRLAAQDAHAVGVIVSRRDDHEDATRCSICASIASGPAATSRVCVDARVACRSEIGETVDLLYDRDAPEVVREAQLVWSRHDAGFALPGLAVGLAVLALGASVVTGRRRSASPVDQVWRWKLTSGETVTAKLDLVSRTESVFLGRRLVSRTPGGARPGGHEVPLRGQEAGVYRGKSARVMFSEDTCRLVVDGVEVESSAEAS